MMGGFPVGFGFIFLYNSANNLPRRHLPAPRRIGFGGEDVHSELFGVLGLCYSQPRCTTTLATSGPARFSRL